MAYTGLIQFSNHAATTLASDVTAAATSFSVATGDGALFPTLTGSQFFYATLEDVTDSTEFEVVKVTARSTDTFTVTRAQDGTSAQDWQSADKVQLRIPKVAITTLETQLSDYADTVSTVAWTAPGTIGSATPNTGKFTTLQTTGETTAGAAIALADAVPGVTTAKLYNSGGNLFWAGVDLSSGSSKWTTVGGTNIYRDSLVHIGGTGDPTYQLQVTGTTSFSGNSLVGGTLGVTGDVAVNTNKFTVAAASGNTVVAGTLGVTGATTLTGALAANGGVTLGDAAGDALTINSSAVTCANGINFDSNTLVIDATNNRVGVATASPGTPLDVTGVARATSVTLLSGGGGQITFQDGTTMNTAGLGSASALAATGNADITGDSDNNGVGDINFISGATTVATIEPDNTTTWNYAVYGKGAGLGHHVDAYGASTAETAANNKTAIDLAVAAAIAGTNGSNTVIFGPGTYSTNAIVIPMTTTTAKGINIVGAGSKGAQATVISIAAAATGFHFSSDAATEDATTYGSFTLRDISFTGGAISIQIGTAAKVYHPRSKFILDNVFCELYTSNGIKVFNTLEGQMQNVVVRGVEGHTAGDSALYITADTAGLTCGDITFYNCEFSGYAGGAVVADYAMYVTTGAVASTVTGLKFTDTHFYHGGTTAAHFAGSAGIIQDIAFFNCQFDYSGAATTTNVGIWLDNTDAATEEDVTMWKDFRIVGNYFQSYGKALYIQPGTAALHNLIAKQVTFSNNYVANCDAYAVSIQSAEDVVVSNNVFRHCGSGSASYLVNMAGWNRSFVISNNTHTANRSGTAGSQTPQNSNITSLVALGASSDHFTVSGNVGQIRDSATNAITLTVDMNTANGSVYGNIAYTSGLTGTTAYNYFDGTIQTLGTIYAGAFSGPGSAITALNASNISSGTMAVSYLGTGGTYPANSGASITNVDAITLLGNTWAIPEAIGATTPAAGTFTTLAATTTTFGLKVGTTSTPSESTNVMAVMAVAAGSGLSIGWNKAGGAAEAGATAYINYGGAGTGGHQFFNFNAPGGVWTSTSPTLLGGFTSDGALFTRRSGSSYNWHLMTYTATAPAATGYVSVYIDGVLYKLLAST